MSCLLNVHWSSVFFHLECLCWLMWVWVSQSNTQQSPLVLGWTVANTPCCCCCLWWFLFGLAHTACIICFTCIIVNEPHPFQCFSCRLSDPVHSILTEIKSSPPTRKTQGFLRLFQHGSGGNGFHSLASQTCQRTPSVKRQVRIKK